MRHNCGERTTGGMAVEVSSHYRGGAEGDSMPHHAGCKMTGWQFFVNPLTARRPSRDTVIVVTPPNVVDNGGGKTHVEPEI